MTFLSNVLFVNPDKINFPLLKMSYDIGAQMSLGDFFNFRSNVL